MIASRSRDSGIGNSSMRFVSPRGAGPYSDSFLSGVLESEKATPPGAKSGKILCRLTDYLAG